MQKGIPFAVKLPERPVDVSKMSATQLDEELEKGYADMQEGRTVAANKVFADIREEYKV